MGCRQRQQGFLPWASARAASLCPAQVKKSIEVLKQYAMP